MNKVPGKMKCYQHLKQLQSLCISGALPFQRRAGRVFDYGAWRLGVFLSPNRPDMGKLVRRWPFAGLKASSLLSHRLFVLGWGPLPEFREPGQQERPRRASGSCYLPGGAEASSSSESAGSHPDSAQLRAEAAKLSTREDPVLSAE